MLSERNAALKTAFRLLTNACGGLDAAAAACRAHRSTLEQYYSARPECHTVFPALDVVADLEAAAGQYLVTEALMRLATGPAAVMTVPLDGRATVTVAPSVAEAARALDAAQHADADGRLSDAELDVLLQHLQRTRSQVDQVTERLIAEKAKRRATE